jgi:hypothetical protein
LFREEQIQLGDRASNRFAYQPSAYEGRGGATLPK